MELGIWATTWAILIATGNKVRHVMRLLLTAKCSYANTATTLRQLPGALLPISCPQEVALCIPPLRQYPFIHFRSVWVFLWVSSVPVHIQLHNTCITLLMARSLQRLKPVERHCWVPRTCLHLMLADHHRLSFVLLKSTKTNYSHAVYATRVTKRQKEKKKGEEEMSPTSFTWPIIVSSFILLTAWSALLNIISV